jgi:diguanylate cyclase (GGDEF)-like protein
LVGRARELLAIAHNDEPELRLRHTEELDRLLAEARHRGEPRMVAQLLRAAVVVRVTDCQTADSAEPLLDDLLAHTRRHGLVVLQADAHALRGRRLLLLEAEDKALSEAAVALAMLDEEITPDVMLGRRTSDVLMASTLMDIGLVLTQLGVYEVADKVMTRAHRYIRASGGPQMISVHLVDRIRLLLGWALGLERVGQDARAIERFATAAAIATAVEALFPQQSDEPACAEVTVVSAAHALAHPDRGRIERLTELYQLARYPRDLMVVAIGLARCLEHVCDTERAVAVLGQARERLRGTPTEPTLRLCLIREFARLSAQLSGEHPTSATQDYTTALESELWAARESRIATLNTRREHERLARRQTTIERQALQDPLTGLPNRRALDERLAELAASSASQPLAIALIDLDRFKSVNDRMSHAQGDEVLRAVASTLRDSLRGNDMVARYGGDEFIALLPGAPLPAAEAALQRAVTSVANLPSNAAHGVTLSIGAVSLRPQETASRALARADAAMYQAKRKGGNGIVAVHAGVDGTEDVELSPRVLTGTELSDAPTDPAWVFPDTT